MRKLQVEDADVMRFAIQQEIVRSKESRYDHRLHGLLLAMAGQSYREVAELFGEDETTVQRWIHRFEQGGLDALRERERSGRPRTLDATQWRKLQSDLHKTPQDFGLAAALWDGPVLAEHLGRRYSVDLGVRQCQRLFRQMGSRLRKPYPQSAQADPLKVAAVKKTAASGSKGGCGAVEPGRIPLPATRDQLPNVGTTGGQGSPSAACPDVPLHRLRRRGQSARRAIRPPHLRRNQRPDLPALPQTAAALSARPASHDRDARQCPLSSRRAAEALPAPARQRAATAVPAAPQPPACLDRSDLEAGSASGHPQPLLPNTRRCRQGGQRLLRSLASAQSGAEKAMLHYLRRRV